jgi:hypothetical protein
MKCQECELWLADGAVDALVEDHLRGCVECRAFQEELRANTLALSSLRDDPLPGSLPGMKGPVREPRLPWMSAAAAAALLVLIAYQAAQWRPVVETIPRPRVVTEDVTVRPEEPVRPARKRPVRRKLVSTRRAVPAGEPMLVKMLTADPDVVVYWLAD